MTTTSIHNLHKKFLLDHVGIDRIIEDRGLFRTWNSCFSEFVTSQGGDVNVYRVYGENESEMKCYIH